MSRPLRKNVVGGWYHVTSRGHNRRDVTLWAARRLGGYTLRELADEVGGLDYSAIYQAVRRIESRAKEDKELAVRMETFRDKLKSVYNV